MKKTFLLIFLLVSLLLKAQPVEEPATDLPCGTEITQQQLDYLRETAMERQTYRHLFNQKSTLFIPVQNHVVRRSDGSGGLGATELSNIMFTLNHYYGNVNMYFYECAPANYINDGLYFDFDNSQENSLAGIYDVNNVINIYYFNSVTSGGSSVCGYSRFPPSADRVIMDNGCALNGSTIVHELGHYFSLFHTHGKTNTGSTDELVNGSNCTFAGDNLCDTPADPNLTGVVNNCTYTGTATDLHGQSYTPQVSNIMSYATKACRRTFTGGQYNRILFSAQFDRNYLLCNPTTPVADFTVDTRISCQGRVEFYDRSTSLPATWNWDFGDGSSSASRHPVHYYTANGKYTVTLTTTNANGTDSQTKINYITVSLPDAPQTNQADSVCKNEQAILSGAGSGTLYWYASATDDVPLGSGNPFLTPPITTPATFYAANHLSNPVQNAGPSGNAIGSGGYLNNEQHLLFDASKPFVLQSVTVYSNTSALRTFELRNFLGLVLQDTTVMVGTGQQTVSLNFTVPAGQDMQLGLSPSSTVGLYRNNSGVSYPYDIPGLRSSKGGSASPAFYYFFYNWQVKEADCVSAKVPVTVHMKNCVVGIEAAPENFIDIYPNPNKGIFIIRQAMVNPVDIEIYNLVGRLVYRQKTNKKLTELNMSGLPEGVYFVKLLQNGQVETKKMVIR